MRALAVATLVCTALMVGHDLLPPSELTTTKRELAYAPLSNEWRVGDARDVVRWPEGGSFALVFDYVSGDLPTADSVDTAYPDESARMQVGWALFKFGYLLAPFIAVGFVVGLRVWVTRNVRFRTRGSERAFAFALSWVVGPALPLSLMWVEGRAVQHGVAQLGLHTILVPPLVFAALAALGWRAGVRSVRLAADLDTVPGEE